MLCNGFSKLLIGVLTYCQFFIQVVLGDTLYLFIKIYIRGAALYNILEFFSVHSRHKLLLCLNVLGNGTDTRQNNVSILRSYLF